MNWEDRIKVRGYSAKAPHLCEIYIFFFLWGKRRYLSWWRQGENNSICWLRLAFLGWYKINIFQGCTICRSLWQGYRTAPCQGYPRRWSKGCWSPSAPKYIRPAQCSRVSPGGQSQTCVLAILLWMCLLSVRHMSWHGCCCPGKPWPGRQCSSQQCSRDGYLFINSK